MLGYDVAYLERKPALASSAVLAAVLVLSVTFVGLMAAAWVAGQRDRSDYLLRIYGETARTFAAAVDPRFQSKADEIARVMDRLVVIEVIRGGALFDDTGHLQQVFGESPETAFETMQRSTTHVFAVRDTRRAEFHLPQSENGTRFHVLLRVDVGVMSSLEGHSIDRMITISAIGATIAAIAVALFCWWRIMRPLARIGRVLEKVTQDPSSADGGERLPGDWTEIGLLSQQVDRFRTRLADIWKSKVVIADAILEQSPLAVLQMAADGSPTFANPTAVRLLGRDLTRDQQGGALVVRDVRSGVRSVLREHFAKWGGETRLVEVATAGETRYLLAGCFLIGADTRVPITVALFADATELQRARLIAEDAYAAGAVRLSIAHRREFELRLMLESCLTLLAGPDKKPDAHIDVLPFAREWIDAATTVGLITAVDIPAGEGPQIAGPADDLRAVVRLAMLVAYSRMGSTPCVIGVDARGINFETAGVTIKAAPSTQDGVEHAAPAADWQLAFAALRTALRRVNGQLGEFTSTENATVVKFILRGAAERVSAVKSR